MKKFEITVNTWEEASIDYVIYVDALSEEEAERIVEEAIENDGTAFIQFNAESESIIDTVLLDSEVECVDNVKEIIDKGDKYEDHF